MTISLTGPHRLRGDTDAPVAYLTGTGATYDEARADLLAQVAKHKDHILLFVYPPEES